MWNKRQHNCPAITLRAPVPAFTPLAGYWINKQTNIPKTENKNKIFPLGFGVRNTAQEIRIPLTIGIHQLMPKQKWYQLKKLTVWDLYNQKWSRSIIFFVRHLSNYLQQIVTGIWQRDILLGIFTLIPREGASEFPYDVQDTIVELTAEFGEFKDLPYM